MNINRVFFTENLTAEPEVNYTPKDTSDSKSLTCVDVNIRGKPVENFAKLAKKGQETTLTAPADRWIRVGPRYQGYEVEDPARLSAALLMRCAAIWSGWSLVDLLGIPVTLAVSLYAIISQLTSRMMATACARFDIARFGAEVMRFSPRQSDVMIVAGTATYKMALAVKRIYDQMPEPKWVIAMGACASSGGMYRSYAVLQGIDLLLPVDVYVSGCPPRPEALLDGLMKPQHKIEGERAFADQKKAYR